MNYVWNMLCVVFCLPATCLLLTCGGIPPERETEATPPEPGRIHPFAAAVEQAHGYDAWRNKDAFETEFQLGPDDQPMMKGTILFEVGSGRSRLELDGGVTLVWDGQAAWVSPADAAMEQARFHALTWPYFIAVAMKLADPGATLAVQADQEVLGETCHVARMTFAAGTGDSPDDWYLVYQIGFLI